MIFAATAKKWARSRHSTERHSIKRTNASFTRAVGLKARLPRSFAPQIGAGHAMELLFYRLGEVPEGTLIAATPCLKEQGEVLVFAGSGVIGSPGHLMFPHCRRTG